MVTSSFFDKYGRNTYTIIIHKIIYLFIFVIVFMIGI